MNVHDALVGETAPRIRVTVITVTVLFLASVAFLLEFDMVLTVWVMSVPLAIALYSGWRRAGVLMGCGAVFLVILWRFVFPPLIGYLRWAENVRYTPPRILAYKLDPWGELLQGFTYGPVYAFFGAIILGGAAYVLGTLLRQSTGQGASGD